VVELKHLDGGGEIEVVVVGGLILAGVDARAETGEEEDGEQEEQESDGAGGVWVEIGGFKWRTGFGDGDSEEGRRMAARRPRRIIARRTGVLTARMRLRQPPRKIATPTPVVAASATEGQRRPKRRRRTAP
jgi:hypothetical protein